jgi:AraC-like DNA-binding protein
MRGSFSTDRVPAKDRLAYWSDLVCDVFVKLDCRSSTRHSFNAAMQYDTLGWLRVVGAESNAIEAVRSHRQIAKGYEDDLLVSIQIEGQTQLVQNGREAVLSAGDFALYDSERPYSLRMSDETRLVCLQFPRKELVGRLGPVSPFVARANSGKGGVGRFFLDLARVLPQRASEIEGNAVRSFADHVIDLLALSLDCGHAGSLHLASSRSLMLARLKRVICDHIRDPELGPALAARLGGMSVRHANRLLAEEGTSLERFILSERLACCASVLGSAKFDHLSVSEVAYSSGFNDASHFSRTFRTRYGLSPKAYRLQKRSKPKL